MSKTFELIHETHAGVDERRWRIVEAVNGALIIQAWPDGENDDAMTAITLRRFGTEICIDPPEPKPITGLERPEFAMINRLQLYRLKLLNAGVADETIPPFVVHSSEVETFLRAVHVPAWHREGIPVDEQIEKIAALMNHGLANFFGVRVAWSELLDRYVRPA